LETMLVLNGWAWEYRLHRNNAEQIYSLLLFYEEYAFQKSIVEIAFFILSLVRYCDKVDT